MSSKSAEALKGQKKAWAALLALTFLLAGGVSYLMIGDIPNVVLAQPKAELPADKIHPQDIWMTKVESANQLFDQKLRFLEGLILNSKKEEQAKSEEGNQLREEITRLKSSLKQLEANREKATEATVPLAVPVQPKTSTPHTTPRSPSDDPFITVGSISAVKMTSKPALKEVVMAKTQTEALHIDQAIPAGTSVRAILVSSIDAPCGVYAAGDPQPVKLRILDDGHLPKEVMAKLKGGLVIASAYGDISTERVLMRLERLTLVEPGGQFVETEITGFVSGEDGKYGVRGTVVDKSCKLVANAAYSGFFSGIGQFLNATVVAGASQANCCGSGLPFGWEMLEASSLQGTSNAFDTLADYYIQRAEQIVPVVEVTAGRTVDITFTHVAKLGDLHTQEKVREIRQQHTVTDRSELRRHNHGPRITTTRSPNACRRGDCPRKAS